MFFIRCAKVWHMPTPRVCCIETLRLKMSCLVSLVKFWCDWGIAKILNQYVPADTEEISKPTTLSLSRSSLRPAWWPEPQPYGRAGPWRIENISFRTDIYALGAILYEILSVRRLILAAPLISSIRSYSVHLRPSPFSDQPAMDMGLWILRRLKCGLAHTR